MVMTRQKSGLLIMTIHTRKAQGFRVLGLTAHLQAHL